MKVDWAYLTHRGDREKNQDAFTYLEEEGRHLFVLADGLGGHKKGEEASRFVCDFIRKNISKMEDNKIESLEALTKLANRALVEYQIQMDLREDIKTTILTLLLTEEVFMYVSVGDTRLYQLSNKHIVFQSKDHSLCQRLVDIDELDYKDIRHNSDRNKLYSVLGNKAEITYMNSGYLKKIPSAFLLCTDGLWEHVIEGEIEVDLFKSQTPKEWLDLLVKRAFCNATLYMDNITAITIFIKD
ncbi:protein phosphatase [Natranaerovirga pectinivora]|uniref:Protein phosphatase n=1 Tax=Natranaerovirga pectinivora TaxID=682400 RepID=A0A4R3MMF6_9FIRM|nr:protein phosphatase 2C domain-containing protein [Natranaerovirga pectinivora]TCT16125.1 protein phosphatase [Natranaerovirga pectinivora]